MSDGQVVMTSLFSGLLGYAIALTIYAYVGLPYAMAVLLGACFAFCSGLIVALILTSRTPPKPNRPKE